jgi:sugar lactone lactonase YvrE
MKRLALAIVVLGACATQAPLTPARPEAYERAASEGWSRMRAKDYRASVQRFERALAANPGDDVVTYLLALASLRAGDTDAAMKWLERLADAKSDLVPREEQFHDLAQNPRFPPIVARVKANAHHTSAEAFRVPEKGLLPEGIAYDPVDGAFYLGSTTRRKIVKVPRGGPPVDFAGPRPEIDSIGGLRVDAKRRRLWAVSGTDDRMDGYVKGEPERNALLEIDMTSGALVGQYPLHEEGRHGVNDVAVDADGRPFATDTASGQIYTLAPDRRSLAPVFAGPPFNFPNGIAFDEAGRVLFVGDATGVHRVDPDRKTILRLTQPRGASLSFFDGLYVAHGRLVGVQIIAGPGRVVVGELSPSLDAVTAVAIVESDHPLFDGPTTGAVVGDELFVIANSQLWGPREPSETIVLRTPLTGAGFAVH